MAADTTAHLHRASSQPTFAAAELVICLQWSMAALLAVGAVFFASRRLAGALAIPLGIFPLLVAGLLLSGLAGVVHAPIPRGRLRAEDLLVSLSMLGLAASLSLPGSHGPALFGFWALIVGEELWAWRGMLPARLAARWARRERVSPNHLSPAPPPSSTPADGDLSEECEPAEPAADVLQQLTLRTTPEGGQELSGWLRLPLAAGQRTANLHVAFCPPFGHTPQVEAEVVSGPDCRIKTAQVLPYGARLDVKLDEPARDHEGVLVWFFASGEG